MKNILLILAMLLASTTISAQSLWNEGIDGNFDNWEDVNGILLPKGWYGTTYGGTKVTVEPATNRKGEEGKACKFMNSYNVTWHTWHWSVRTVAQESFGTVNILDIPAETDFYYTFWAKATNNNTKLYLGIEEIYNPDWDTMPYVELTTEWKQYGVLVPASEKVGKTFAIHIRQDAKQQYIFIDDIVLERGNVLPELNVEEPEPTTSLWNDGLDGSFDNWEDHNGSLLPKGWYGTEYSGLKTTLTPVADRNGEENKACKISSNFTGAVDHWYNWHLAAATVDNVNNGILNILNIADETDFYYTFWAKAEVDGMKMYIGVPQMYDPNHGGLGWDAMPYVELTTQWEQYGILQKSNYNAKTFSIQLRGNKTLYIDDIVLEKGDILPPITPVNVGAVQAEGMKMHSKNGILYIQSDIVKTISVYGIDGRKIAEQQLSEGTNTIESLPKGIYLINNQKVIVH